MAAMDVSWKPWRAKTASAQSRIWSRRASRRSQVRCPGAGTSFRVIHAARDLKGLPGRRGCKRASRPGGTASILPGERRDGRSADDGLRRGDGGLYVARGPDRLGDVESVLLAASGWPVLGETSAPKPELACSRCEDKS